MADPTADDETSDVSGSDEGPESGAKGSALLAKDDDSGTEDTDAADEEAEEADDTTSSDEPSKTVAPKKRPDPRADVAARRAATKARMDADGDKPKAKATAGDPTGTKARREAAPAKATADDPTGAKARRDAAGSGKKVARPSKRTGGAADPRSARAAAARSGNPKKAAEAAETTRYTAPIPRSQLESPVWVPILMFTLLGLGGLVILLTYMLWGGRPLTLGVGLAFILGGILTATQYR